ncbi:hypothetical protein P175DRAFT_0272686 [Aspergillus ochraceoroseus IBT 24754]|uniref:Ornithine decarboxylase antizyme n=1 Tax=Aspergillus ochraceoroseus IBT 24754 TaxID=1392256 RepID=A0A2T5LV58_9EURO|nr:uncharacterized protein P175DRAFT_0272686 [Aspergillus ochraceoroseus IBT 24754]PTU20169.1 hypothetical protein P175DRAFT_0272686 [Aspergillus ochraceoroseus IBT 24754]
MAFITALLAGPEYSGIPEVPSGSKMPHLSPPLDLSIALGMGNSLPGCNILDQKGEATHTIPGECERLFCDKLSAIFLGERRSSRHESLGLGASLIPPNQIQQWVEVLDYTGDAIYRGFITNTSGERTLFVFFTESALGNGLKSGLIALFELADMPAFECSQIVVCAPRSQDGAEIETIRNFGWCGFSLTTLQPWDTRGSLESSISPRWLFLSAEV